MIYKVFIYISIYIIFYVSYTVYHTLNEIIALLHIACVLVTTDVNTLLKKYEGGELIKFICITLQFWPKSAIF